MVKLLITGWIKALSAAPATAKSSYKHLHLLYEEGGLVKTKLKWNEIGITFVILSANITPIWSSLVPI